MTGHADRQYTALVLPGRFYDPRNPTQPSQSRPHLEISAGAFNRPDPQFPDRLAQTGNALTFPWWIVPEVLAVKRAVLTSRAGDIAAAAEMLDSRRVSLITALAPLARAAASGWAQIEALHQTDPDALACTATAPFTREDVTAYLPPAADLDMEITFDGELAKRAGKWGARRVGVWTLTGTHDGERFSLGVLTPRLTRSSLFTDPLFEPAKESPAALLVRGLLLRRILRDHLGAQVGQPVADAPAARGAGPTLRAVVARVGDKIPHASTESAVHFLTNYPDPDDAWAALNAWASAPIGDNSSIRATLAVDSQSFTTAHRSAMRALRRAEEPSRADIDTVLPLAWDHKSRVVRVTFARPPVDEPAR